MYGTRKGSGHGGLCTTLGWVLGISVGVVTGATTPAAAEVKISETDGWQIFTDGRVNSFLSYATGQPAPDNILPGAGFDSPQVNSNGKINVTRIRSGFVGAVLGFSVKKMVTEETMLTSHIAVWGVAESARDKGGSVVPDMRQAYLKLEGPWGGVLAGRDLNLMSRGAITLDFLYGHGNGLGHPCGIDGIGPTCGHVGFGIIFPGFGAGIVYNTPTLEGLKLTAGLYDPAAISGKYDNTPLPRLEGELEFDRELGDLGKFHLFVNGEVQKAELRYSGAQGTTPQPPADKPGWPDSVTSRGIGYGGWLEISRLAIGFASHFGYGLGMNYAFENTPATITPTGELRKFDGYYGQARVALGIVDLAAGVGISRVFAVPADTTLTSSLIKNQTGISAGAYFHVVKPVVLAVEYFKADYKWYLSQSQSLNFFNTGLTALW